MRPIGADNKIILSEQAPTNDFVICSCTSYSNNKTLATSTVKSLSKIYVLHNSVDKGGKVNPFLVRLKICTITGNTADFHGDGYNQQERWNFKRLTNCFQSVCDVNSLCRHIQVKSIESVVAFTTPFNYTNPPFFHTPHKPDILAYLKHNRDCSYFRFNTRNDIPQTLAVNLRNKWVVSSTFLKSAKILFGASKNQHCSGKPPRTVLTYESVSSFSFRLT